mmetsp:Transcript_4837/g.9422  ORF Transcript_4837/g.9422 Transcript_4837/m.9422 type:complete len:1031 (+) Transcript_4837:94-3186(+)
MVVAANWAELTGPPSHALSLARSWSARWGHAAVVINQTSPRLIGQRSNITSSSPKLLLLGGDDYDLNKFHGPDGESNGGGLCNDIWMTDPSELQRVMRSSSSSSSSISTSDGNGYLRGSTFNDPPNFNLRLLWNEINPGQNPPALLSPEHHAVAYDDWKKANMWSPRRGHSAAVGRNSLYVIGGRTHERKRIDDERLGGQHYRIETLKDHTTTREDVVLKNDVWVSEDGLGKEWKLVTPGCLDPQEDILIHTERHDNRPGGSRCTTSSDCYGSAECKSLASNTSSDKVCVCNMFSPREHHSLVVQQRSYTDASGREHVQEYLFVVGGFTRESGYRVALDDAWVSTDGMNWLQLKPAFDVGHSFRGRGGHSGLLVHSNRFNQQTVGGHDLLIILGGESFHPTESNTTYLNDIWTIQLSTEPCCKNNVGACKLTPRMINEGCLPAVNDWSMQRNADWSGRSGHVSLYEPPSAHNSYTEKAYVMGGMNDKDGVLSDTWTWNLVPGGIANKGEIDINSQQPERWVRDFDGTSQDHGPYQNYLSIDSEVSALVRYRLPILFNNEANLMMSSSPLMNQQDIGKMNALGILSIKDLSDANVYDILKLRGIDNPWLEKTMPAVHNICYLKSLADAFVRKCSSNGSENSPNSAHDSSDVLKYPRKDIEKRNSTYCVVKLPSLECYPYDWDACSAITNLKEVDVYGLGNIAVPQTTHDPSLDLAELHCRRTASGRYMGAGAYIDNKVIVLGGRDETLHTLHPDAWARDERFPLAAITKKPQNYTAETLFEFSSNEPTAQQFEYKVYDADQGIELIPWQSTTVDKGADVSWLDYRKGGPGKGYYTLYVRAIDLSGNRDISYGKNNVYTWRYVPRPPVGKILAGTSCGLFFFSVLVLEYRRRERKAALERYASRRTRRRYRLQQAMTRDDEERNGPGRRDLSLYQWQRLIQDEHEGGGAVEWGDRSYSKRTRSSRDRTRRSRSSRDHSSDGADNEYYSRRKQKRRKHASVDGQRSRSKSLDHRGKLRSRERQRRRERHRKRT